MSHKAKLAVSIPPRFAEACLKDPVLCPLGRCPAHEVQRLESLERCTDQLRSRAENRALVYEWAVQQAIQHLRAVSPQSETLSFLEAVDHSGLDPAHLNLLKDKP